MTNFIKQEEAYLFHEGTHFQSYRMLGAHLVAAGVRFCVWAPKAKEVRVVGDFNHWQGEGHVMEKINQSGLWVLFIPELKELALYKYEIHTQHGEVFHKSDPYAFYSEKRPRTASRVYDLSGYQWQDQAYQEARQRQSAYSCPMVIYEVHLGSWRTKGGGFLTYRELADQLVDYVAEMGYTHVEFLPVMEHPLDGSWGYQITGYYSVTSRYGTPQDLMYLVDRFHQRNVGVILDWVPAHFCRDSHGLRQFDGSSLYEAANPLLSENWQWGTVNFDYSKPEVQSFLISNALFWFDYFHVDGLRIDAVAFMLYLDYGKQPGQWLPNQYGGRENLAAVAFMKKLNETVFQYFPAALMMAEESTAWPLVTKPTYLGGLGYNFKWNMGWMNDLLRYLAMDPIHRKWHHHLLTFSFMYAFSENYVLPLSHDEVVHGKKSLLNKMPGDYWQKFANLRALYGYMMAHPGKKLLFMGGEFGQFIEWNEQQGLDWHLLDYEMHQRLQGYVKDLNHFYQAENCLWELDHQEIGFQWIDPHDYSQSVVSFMRQANNQDFIICIANFTPVVRENYCLGVPCPGEYYEVFNSDNQIYGGSGQTNGHLVTQARSWHNQPYLLELRLPPLAVVFLKAVNTTYLTNSFTGEGDHE